MSSLRSCILCTVFALCTVSLVGAQTPCDIGDIRLTGGEFYGTLEICDNTNVWGTVCASGVSPGVASIVCSQLGLGAGFIHLLIDVDVTTVQPYLATLTCDGDEESLILCDSDIDDSNTPCNAAEFACLPPFSICSLLNCPCNSECVEASNPFDSVCLCNEGFFELDGECVECTDDSMCPSCTECVNFSCEPRCRHHRGPKKGGSKRGKSKSKGRGKGKRSKNDN